MIDVTGAGRSWRDLLAEGRAPRFVLICLAIWLNAADALVTATIMPSVGADIGGYAYFGWATAGFFLGAILAGASAGRISEIIGLRAASASAGMAFAVGCALSAVAPSISLFLLGRLVQGFGSGLVSGLAMVAVALLFPDRHLARVFASISSVWGIATVLAPLLGGLFAEPGTWRVVFWLFAVQAIIFSGASWVLLKGTPGPNTAGAVPWPQLGLLTAAVSAIALADVAHSPPVSVTQIIVGLATLALVLRVEARAPVRLLPRGAADIKTVAGSGYAALFSLMAASMGLLVYGPAVLQELHGLSPLWAGYVVAVQALSWTLGSYVVAGASEPAQRTWIRIGASCVFASLLVLMLVMGSAALAWVVAAAALMGAGLGFCVSLINRRIIGSLSEEDRAVGGAGIMASRQTGGAVGAAIAGATANLVGFGAGVTTATAEAVSVWIFVTALPLASAAVLAAWRLTVATDDLIARPASQNGLPARYLTLHHLEALGPEEQRQLLCALSMLWDEFTSAGHGRASGRGLTEYAASMRSAAHNVLANGGPEKRHYAMAPEFMALYAEGGGSREVQRERRTLIEQLALLGRKLRTEGTEP